MAKDAEIKLILNTKEAIAEAKKFAPELEKALKPNATTPYLKSQQEALEKNIKQAKEFAGVNNRGLDEWNTRLDSILNKWEKLKAAEATVAELSKRKGIDSAIAKNASGRYSAEAVNASVENLKKLASAQKDVDKYERDINKSIAKLPMGLQEAYSKATNVKDVYANQYKLAQDINKEARVQAQLQKVANDKESQLTVKTKDATVATKKTAEATKDLAAEAEKAAEAERKLGEEASAIIPKQKEQAEAIVQNPLQGMAGTESFKDLVETIYVLKLRGEDATAQMQELETRLRGFNTATADAYQLSLYLDDIKEALAYINDDLSKPESLANVFNLLVSSAEPAKQAFRDVSAEAKKTGNDVVAAATLQSQVAGIYATALAGEQARAAEKQRIQDILDAQQQKEIQSKQAYITALLAMNEQLKAEEEQQQKEQTQSRLAYITAMVAMGEQLKEEEERQQREEIQSRLAYVVALNAIGEQLEVEEEERQRAKVQSRQNYVLALTSLFEQEEAEYQEAMQSVIDTTNRVSEAMRADSAQDNIAELVRRLEALKQASATLEEYGIPEGMDAYYNQITQMIAKLTQQISTYKHNLNGVSTEHKKTTKSVNLLDVALSGLKRSLKTIGSAFSGVRKGFSKLRSAMNGMSRDMNRTFKQNIQRITKYVLGFRSLFFLVRRLRKYVGEGIQNLVRFNNGNNKVNESITRLLSSLLYLKNAWAAAFSPIITAITPWLEGLIDKLAEVGNAVARFIGALTGQTVVFNAVKVQAQDYASTLDNVGSSAGGAADKAKKLKDRLAAFDDLNILGKDDDNDGSGSGGGGGLADAYAPDPNDMFTIVEAQSELADKIKKAWEESGFFGIGHLISQSIADWLGDIDWEDFKDDAETLGKGFGDFFNGLFGNPDFWNNLGNGAAGLVNGLIYAIKGFLDANSGTNYGQMIAEGFNNFLNNTDWKQAGLNLHDFCTGILDNIKSFFDTEDPQALASSIHDFLEGVNIGDIIWKFGQVIVSAAKVVIQVVAELVVEWGGDLGDAMWENSNLSKVTAADKGTEQYGKLMLTAQFGDWVTEQQMKTYQQILDNGLKDLWDTALVWSNVVFPNPLTHLIAFWDEAKQGWEDGWATFETVIWGDENWQGGIAEWIANLGGFGNLYDLAYGGATDLGDGFSNGMQDWWNNMATQWSAGWNAMIDWFKDIFGIHSPSTLFYDFAGDIMQGLWNGLVVAWENVKTFFSNIGTWVSNKWTEIKNKTAEIWTNIKTWLTTTVEGIRDKIATVFTVIKSKILYIWESIKEGIKSPINGILGFIESFVNKCIDGINGLIDKINGIADVEFKNPFNNQTYTLGFNIPKLNNVSIPRLAQGAVIPPNREFMAVLGDQSHGTNVEAPLDVIKQAVAEVLANNGNEEVIRLLQQLIGVVESKNLVIGDKDIGKANARYVKQQNLIRGVSF